MCHLRMRCMMPRNKTSMFRSKFFKAVFLHVIDHSLERWSTFTCENNIIGENRLLNPEMIIHTSIKFV